MGRTLYGKHFHIRVTERQYDAVRRAAAEAERSPTDWIRETIRLKLEAEDKRRARAAR